MTWAIFFVKVYIVAARADKMRRAVKIKQGNQWIILIIILVALPLIFLKNTTKSNTKVKIEPAKVEPVSGTDFKQVTLSEEAAKRLGIKTSEMTQMTVPYSSVIYGLQGETWVYINPKPLVFARHPIEIDHIEDDQAFISKGPPLGTKVVIVGVAELYGADTGIGK